MGYSSNTTSDRQSVELLIPQAVVAALLAIAPLPIWAAANAAAMPQPALKIYVSVDMEGVAGVVSGVTN